VSNNKVTFLEVGLEDKEVIEGDSFSNFEQKPHSLSGNKFCYKEEIYEMPKLNRVSLRLNCEITLKLHLI
jgi:hypothetical protein